MLSKGAAVNGIELYKERDGALIVISNAIAGLSDPSPSQAQNGYVQGLPVLSATKIAWMLLVDRRCPSWRSRRLTFRAG